MSAPALRLSWDAPYLAVGKPCRDWGTADDASTRLFVYHAETLDDAERQPRTDTTGAFTWGIYERAAPGDYRRLAGA